MKLTGSILIIIAAIIISFFYEKQQQEKIMRLKAVLHLIDYIKNQISYFSRPVKDIYMNYKLQNDDMSALISGNVTDLPFCQDLKDELYACFSSLGSGYKDEEIKKLEYVALKLSKEISKAEKELPQKIKVFRAISIFISCSVVILLV